MEILLVLSDFFFEFPIIINYSVDTYLFFLEDTLIDVQLSFKLAYD